MCWLGTFFFIDIIIIMPNDEHGDSGQDNVFSDKAK